MVKLDESDDRREGPRRPRPDASASISTTARFYRDDEMKDMLAARQPFGDWVKRIRQIDHIVKTDAPEPVLFEGEALRRRQLAVGFTMEELELILHPMVEDAQEASARWATTRRSPCCRTSIAACIIIFRQTFSQVTNPPIDSLRETPRDDAEDAARQPRQRAGRGPSQCDLLQLESPVLSTAEFQAMRAYHGERPPAWSTAPSRSPTARRGLRAALERIRREAEEGVRAGCTHVILTDEASGPERAAIPMILATGGVHTHLVRQSLRTFTSLNVRSRASAWTCTTSPC